MLQTAIRPHELAATMRERMEAVLAMGAAKLDLNWATEFSPAQLADCCKRIGECFSETEPYTKGVQQELIQSEPFAPWLSQFRELARPGDSEDSSSPGWSALQTRLAGLLKVCWQGGRDITAFAATDVFGVLEFERLSSETCLTYLENFAPMNLSCGAGAELAANLAACTGLPAVLTDEQRALLVKPFVATRYLFATEDFSAVSELFSLFPELAEIALLLHQNGIEEFLTLLNYQYFAEDAPEYHRLLAIVIQRLGRETSELFLRHWQRNGCTLSELRRIESRTRTAGEQGWDETLITYSGYVNLLFGRRFKNIDLGSVLSYQEGILTYAITHNKKHFIRLVDGHWALFSQIPSNSILYYQDFYSQRLNLNELTEKDLDDCAWMTGKNRSQRLLTANCRYTFAEVRLLYEASSSYVTLYGKLQSEDLDYRIRVMRQLLKRDALDDISSEEELSALAARLDQKPLHNWRQEDFGHVEGLTAGDTARLLIHLDKLAHLLPSIKNRTDTMLVLRNLERLEQFGAMDTLKANLFEADPDWCSLADDMKLTQEFKAQYQDEIMAFLCRDGAGIAQTYARELNDNQREAFHRVVKAELMGQFITLKYFEGDLERELGCPVSLSVKANWPQNGIHTDQNMTVLERDDFFSTILLGTQPYATCLSYHSGSYRHCLLACFDSNKKVLYAKKNDRVVGRACIRLTKCCMGGAGKTGSGPKFDFVDLEDIAGSREPAQANEWVTLFLERPYISRVDTKAQREIERLFIAFARQKARDMGTMLVLSTDYGAANPKGFVRTRLSIYISASKAGEQYLDSLSGQASVSDQGSYEENHFLVEQDDNT